MAKYTRHTLKKLEELFKELAYTIRYEKGNFQSGYCVVKEQKVVVINKFFETEARVNTLVEILGTLELDASALSDAGLKVYQQWTRTQSPNPEEEKPSK